MFFWMGFSYFLWYNFMTLYGNCIFIIESITTKCFTIKAKNHINSNSKSTQKVHKSSRKTFLSSFQKILNNTIESITSMYFRLGGLESLTTMRYWLLISQFDFVSGENFVMGAVYDGHGDGTVAQYLRNNLLKNIVSKESFTTNPTKAIIQSKLIKNLGLR